MAQPTEIVGTADGRPLWRSILRWSLFAPLLLTAWILVALLPRQPWRWRALSLLSRLVFRAWGVQFMVEGSVAGAPAAIFAANHSSYFDLLAIAAALPRHPLAFVAKSELGRPAMLGFALRRIGTLFVDRSAAATHGAVLRRMMISLDSGVSLLVFPEGTFVAEPGLRRFQLGAFTTAATVGAPIIPLAIAGTRSLLPKNCLRPLPGPVTVSFGPLLETARSDGEARRAAVALHHQTRAFILAKTGESDAG